MDINHQPVHEFIAACMNLSYIATFLISIEWIGFNPQSLGIFVILMLIDIITGVYRAYNQEGGSSVKSAVLKDGLYAKFFIFISLFSVGLTGKGVGFNMDDLVQASVSVLIVGELFSILGNVHSAITGQEKVEFDALSVLLSQVKKLLDRTTPK